MYKRQALAVAVYNHYKRIGIDEKFDDVEPVSYTHLITMGVKILVEHKVKSEGALKGSKLYNELQSAADRLKTVIAHNKGGDVYKRQDVHRC